MKIELGYFDPAYPVYFTKFVAAAEKKFGQGITTFGQDDDGRVWIEGGVSDASGKKAEGIRQDIGAFFEGFCAGFNAALDNNGSNHHE